MKALQNLWITMKEVLRAQLIALIPYRRKLERFHASNLTAYLKSLEQKVANRPKMSENNKTESGNQYTRNKENNAANS